MLKRPIPYQSSPEQLNDGTMYFIGGILDFYGTLAMKPTIVDPNLKIRYGAPMVIHEQ